jgi:hypothetical protein
MTDKQDADKPNGPANQPQQRFRHSRKLGLVRSLMVNIALIAMPVAIYFVVVMEHSSAYADQRSLRALQEIATQVDNRVDALKNIVKSAPGELQRNLPPDWEKQFRSDWKRETESNRKSPEPKPERSFEDYSIEQIGRVINETPRFVIQKLAFVTSCQDVKGKCTKTSSELKGVDCPRGGSNETDIHLVENTDRTKQLRMFDCGSNMKVGEATIFPVVGTTFSQMIENTDALAEIPLIIVASERGEAYLQLARNYAKDANPPAHEEVHDEPTIANLREILAAAEKHAIDDLLGKDERGKSAVPKDGGGNSSKDEKTTAGEEAASDSLAEVDRVGLPVALEAHIAGTPYRAYVLPYPLKVFTCRKAGPSSDDRVDAKTCDVPGTFIYLVGLRKLGPLARAAASLSPLLLLSVLIALVAACLLWPFLRHALLEPNDAVTWRQIHILCVAFLILTALGVLAVRAAEVTYFMHHKMDQALVVVAEDIDTQFERRIRTDLKGVKLLADDPIGKSSKECTSQGEDSVDRATKVVPEEASSIERFSRPDASGKIRKNSLAYNALTKAWICVFTDIDVSNRPYFALLKGSHGIDWLGESMILQRLFNKSDGKKILQLAVSNVGVGDEFAGILSANVGTIEVTAPVLPLGIGYAIFERSTGTVVFHSNDSRSLVENFYAETEHDPTLSSSVDSKTKQSKPFDARYRGASTRFLYRHMSYSPWGLVVYYDPSAVSAVAATSVISALATTVSILLCGLALAHIAIRLAHRRYSWLWPQWRLRNAYPTAAVYLSIVSMCEFQVLRNLDNDIWHTVVLVTAPLFVLTACFSALSAKTPEVTVRRPSFLRNGPGLAQWSRVLHIVLLLTWIIAAGMAGQYRTCLAFGLACVLWATLMNWSIEPRNPNAWRRDLSPWPGSAIPARERESYRARYLFFVMSLVLVVSAAPALALFDRTFEWYLSSALELARVDTNDQWEARVRKVKEDVLAIPAKDRDGKTDVKSLRAAAAKLSGFGLNVYRAGPLIDSWRLFKVDSPSSCSLRPVTWPLGIWEGKMHWEQTLLERLRQQAVASESDDSARPGPCGTIDDLLRSYDAPIPPFLWEIGGSITFLALSMLLLHFSARHVMGISLPWSGRLGRQSRPPAPGPDPIGAVGTPFAPDHILLLQPKDEALAYVLERAPGDIREVDVAADRLDRVQPDVGKGSTWLLRRVEIAVLDETRRFALLRVLERLVADPKTHVIVSGDVSPVYRIARPHAYPGPSWPRIDDHERLRWVDLFSKFYKAYSVDDLKAVYEGSSRGTKTEKAPDDRRARNLEELIFRETRALWPQLKPIRSLLLDRMCSTADITDRDVIEFVAMHGEIRYRKAWEYCTREERLALYQLAQGKLINMSNQRVIEHLLRRGFIVFEPEPRIKSVSLTEFILNAELPGRMEAWAAEAGEGLWQSVRVPFFVALMLVLAWIAYSSGDALQAVVALVATSFAVISQVFRLLGMVGFSAPAKDK